jgi:hypothetical protein
MKNLKILLLCFCLLLSGIYPASSQTEQSETKSATIRKGFPNIFRPVESLFKWIFGGIIVHPVQIPVSVKSLSLNKSEINHLANTELVSSNDSQIIEVISEIHNPKKKKVNYYYVVTVGKITGKGTKAAWDLTGVTPGKYAITAAVEDECGVCGLTQTKTVTVK